MIGGMVLGMIMEIVILACTPVGLVMAIKSKSKRAIVMVPAVMKKQDALNTAAKYKWSIWCVNSTLLNPTPFSSKVCSQLIDSSFN
jgi:hypothetical protein